MAAVQETIDQVKKVDVDQYKYGFETDIEADRAPKGLSEDIEIGRASCRERVYSSV